MLMVTLPAFPVPKLSDKTNELSRNRELASIATSPVLPSPPAFKSLVIAPRLRKTSLATILISPELPAP